MPPTFVQWRHLGGESMLFCDPLTVQQQQALAQRPLVVQTILCYGPQDGNTGSVYVSLPSGFRKLYSSKCTYTTPAEKTGVIIAR